MTTKKIAPLGRLKYPVDSKKTREREESRDYRPRSRRRFVEETRRDLSQCLLSQSSIVFLTPRSLPFSSHWFALFYPFHECCILLVTYDCFWFSFSIFSLSGFLAMITLMDLSSTFSWESMDFFCWVTVEFDLDFTKLWEPIVSCSCVLHCFRSDSLDRSKYQIFIVFVFLSSNSIKTWCFLVL